MAWIQAFLQRISRWMLRGVQFFIGVVFCLTPITAIAVVGWTYRLMQRQAVCTFHRAQAAALGKDGPVSPLPPAAQQWPNWFIREAPGAWNHAGAWQSLSLTQKAAYLLATPIHSLWGHFKTGLLALINTWAITLPGLALWVFAWHAGWNNSFHKVYEQAYVGISSGLLGVALFVAAMLYLPFAQARQAVTGQFRSFYDFGVIRRAMAARWWALVFLAALIVLLNLPVMLFKTLPVVFDRFPQVQALSDAEALAFLQRYWFWVSAVCFPIYVFIHVAAARIYAKSLCRAYQTERINDSSLSEWESGWLAPLPLQTAPQRHLIIRGASISLQSIKAFSSIVILVLLWFGLVAQIFVSEFFNYHPLPRWLNQPLIHMPWFEYTPDHLREAAQAAEQVEDDQFPS